MVRGPTAEGAREGRYNKRKMVCGGLGDYYCRFSQVKMSAYSDKTTQVLSLDLLTRRKSVGFRRGQTMRMMRMGIHERPWRRTGGSRRLVGA